MKSGNLNLLEPSGQLQAWKGTALSFTHPDYRIDHWRFSNLFGIKAVQPKRCFRLYLAIPNLNQIWPGVYCYVPFPLCVYFADILLRTHNKLMRTCVNHWVFASSRARLSIIDVLNTGKLTLRLSTCLPRYNASSCLFTTREILWHSGILVSWPDFICSKGIVCYMLFAVTSVSCNLGVFLYLREVLKY